MGIKASNVKAWIQAAQWCADQTGDINLLKCVREVKIPRQDIYNWAKDVKFWEKVRDLKQPHILKAEHEVDNNLEEQARVSRNPEIKRLYYKKVCKWNEKSEVVHTADEKQLEEFEGMLAKMRKSLK